MVNPCLRTPVRIDPNIEAIFRFLCHLSHKNPLATPVAYQTPPLSPRIHLISVRLDGALRRFLCGDRFLLVHLRAPLA